MSRVVFFAVMLLVGPCCPAQEPVTKTRNLEEELKVAVDRALARCLRQLRGELHGIVERAVRGSSGEDLETTLRSLEGHAVAIPAAPRAGSDLVFRWARLRGRLGDEDPVVRRIALELSSLGLLPEPAPTVLSWAELGLTVGEVSPEFRELHGLDVDQGLRVATVLSGSRAHAHGIVAGDVLVRGGDRPIRFQDPGCPLGTLVSIAQADHLERRVELAAKPTPADEAKRTIDALFQSALRRIVPSHGIIVPSEPPTGEGRRP